MLIIIMDNHPTFLDTFTKYYYISKMCWREILSDCAQAYGWARAHSGSFGADVVPPALIGHSAGAYNAAIMPATRTRRTTHRARCIVRSCRIAASRTLHSTTSTWATSSRITATS